MSTSPSSGVLNVGAFIVTMVVVVGADVVGGATVVGGTDVVDGATVVGACAVVDVLDDGTVVLPGADRVVLVS